VLGAFADGRPVGCLISFLGAAAEDENRPAMANLKLYSKRLAVLEAYRDRGIGYQLKLAQRDFAMRRGIRLVTWTFDPLLSRNAHMNIRKLGAVVSRYYVDFYGTDSESLTLGGSSDRLEAEWWLTSHRVEERLKGSRSALTLDQYLLGGVRILNPSTLSARALPVPSDEFIQPPSALGLLEIPPEYDRLVEADPVLAQEWREHTRQVFTAALHAGYILTDFVYEPYQGRQRGFYVCSHEGSLRRFSQN
jgi:predicted GNAT superfamily acetyltransferase